MEWKEVRLGDIVSIKSGLAYKGAFIGKGENILLGMGCVSFKDKFLFSGARAYEADCDDKYCVDPGDIVLATRQQSDNLPILAMPAIIPSSLKAKKIIYGTNLYKVENHSEVTNDFLFWQLKTPDYIDYISSVKTGSVVRMVTKKNVEDYVFRCPPKEVRDRISKLLWGLDRKIELNNKINADLEEMAQAIFKNWFVDFEPFKDGEFVDSELGMIPEGWKVVTLDDLTSKFGTGLNPRKNFVLGHGNNYYVTIKNMGDNRIYLNDRCDKVDDEALAKINKRSKLQKGDLLFSGIGTIGRVAMVVEDPLNWNTSESVFNMHPIDSVSSEFIYLLLLSDIFQQYVRQNAQGGVQQGIRMASLKAFQLAIPDDLKFFDNLVKPIIAKVKSNDRENDRLSLLRDTLLPRLMSGELEVPE